MLRQFMYVYVYLYVAMTPMQCSWGGPPTECLVLLHLFLRPTGSSTGCKKTTSGELALVPGDLFEARCVIYSTVIGWVASRANRQASDPSSVDVQPVRVVANGVVGGIGGSTVLGKLGFGVLLQFFWMNHWGCMLKKPITNFSRGRDCH